MCGIPVFVLVDYPVKENTSNVKKENYIIILFLLHFCDIYSLMMATLRSRNM